MRVNDFRFVLQSQEELREARRVYEELNTDLHMELPALYERSVDERKRNCQLYEKICTKNIEIAEARCIM